jgi:hypothetical protein
MSTTAEQQKIEQEKVKGAVKMRKLISPMFQQAVEDALATQDVYAFWEEIDAAIITGMEQYAHSRITSLAEEAERLEGDVANYQEWTWQNVAAWLRQKAEER